MEQLKNKNHLTPGLSDVLATRLAVKVAIPVPPVVAVVMTVMVMTADVLPTRVSILDTAATTRLAVKMVIPEPPVLADGHDGGGRHDGGGDDGGQVRAKRIGDDHRTI